MTPFLAPLLELSGAIIQRVWPDASEAERRRLETFAAELDREYRLRLAQMDVNRQEARSPHWFVAGWRPAAGWVCVAAFGWIYLLYPLIAWLCFFIDASWIPPRPATDGILTELLFGLLGLGGLRTFEKMKGVARP